MRQLWAPFRPGHPCHSPNDDPISLPWIALIAPKPRLVGLGHLFDELLPSEATANCRKFWIDYSGLSIECHDSDAFEQVRSISLGPASAGTREPSDGPFDQVCRWLPGVVAARPHPFGCRQREDAADNREWELEMEIDGKANAPKSSTRARPVESDE